MVWELGAKLYKQVEKFWREKEHPLESAESGCMVTYYVHYRVVVVECVTF